MELGQQMKRVIEKLKINFVSLCPQGMNPDAHILLSKEKNDENLLKEEMEDMKVEKTIEIPHVEASDLEPFDKAFLELAKELTPYISPNSLNAEQLQDMVKKCFEGYWNSVLEKMNEVISSKFDKALSEFQAENKGEEEKVQVGKEIVEKEKVGEEAFNLLKSLKSQVEALQEEQKLNKCIQEMKTGFPHLPIEDTILGKMKLNLSGLPVDLQKEYFKVFELADKYGESLLKEVGSSATVLREADAPLPESQILEYQKERNCSFEDAFLAVMKKHNISE